MSIIIRLFFRREALVSALLLGISSAVAAEADDAAHHEHHHQMAAQSASPIHDAHAQHRQALDEIGYKRTQEHYTTPQVELTTMQGTSVALEDLLDTDEPLMVNFIFTSCTTICPIMSATFAQAQKKLADEATQIRWISISIDPEYDTPQRLKGYAKHFQAGDHWSFLTGSNENIVTLQKAFDVYRGDKMNHIPVTLMRAGRDAPWVRLHGLTSSTELVSEYRQLMMSHHH